MTRAAQRLIKALLDDRWLTPAAVASGLRVVDVTRRQPVWIVTTADGPSFVVKQSVDPAGQKRLAREAAIYDWLRAVEDRHGSFLPEVAHHAAVAGRLILSHVAGVSLAEALGARSWRNDGPAAALGRTLADVHQAGVDGLDPGLSSEPPWTLAIHRPDQRWHHRSSEASLQLRAMIQQHPEIGDALDALRDEWSPSTLIHGDLKLEHVIVSRDDRRRPAPIVIIDWELAQAGDPAWDVGAVFAAGLLRWLRSIPIVAGKPPGDLAGLATIPIQRVQSFLSAFWQAYLAAGALISETPPEVLLRATRSAAAILIQREEEALQSEPDATTRTLLILQVSRNMLVEPSAGVSVLLGLGSV